MTLAEGYTLMDWALLVAALGTTVLGIVIGYQAYRGFRRNDSRPMQYLSVGLLLLTGVAYSISFVGTLLLQQGTIPIEFQQPLTLVVRLIQFVGLGFITLSLYRRP